MSEWILQSVGAGEAHKITAVEDNETIATIPSGPDAASNGALFVAGPKLLAAAKLHFGDGELGDVLTQAAELIYGIADDYDKDESGQVTDSAFASARAQVKLADKIMEKQVAIKKAIGKAEGREP